MVEMHVSDPCEKLGNRIAIGLAKNRPTVDIDSLIIFIN